MLTTTINRRRITAALILLAAFLSRPCPAAGERPLSRIAFGSCARQDRPQPIWDAVVNFAPERFVFLGDNIYGDTRNMDVLRRKWALLAAQPGYRKLKATCPVLATWDDHDYGENDAGREYPKKRESQQVFLDFFEEPADSPRRTREGVYDAKLIGPPDRQVQVILLDTRYFRSPLKTSGKRYEPGSGLRGPYAASDDEAATILGETQWKWLEEQLTRPARLRIIASSIQVVADDHWWEKWGNFPRERERLFELIRRTKAGGVVFVSGDRHKAEISRIDAGAGYPLYDVTSSSLNQPSRWRNELNRHRVGLMYFEENFGTILIDWKQPDPPIRLQVRDIKGDVVLQQKLALSELQPGSSRPGKDHTTKP